MKLSVKVLATLMLVLTQLSPTWAQPFVVGDTENDNLVKNLEWKAVGNLSDEFSGNSLDTSKWDSRGIIPGRFFWLGRWPGLFEADNIHLRDGELWLAAEAFAAPKTDERGERDDWTHGGAIIRSTGVMQAGMYTEAKMRTTETIMSGTFWLSSPSADCNVSPKTELDVTESIGIKSGVFKAPELGWYANVANEFELGINANCRQRGTSCLSPVNQAGAYGNFDPSEDFHVYGVYWETPNDVHFYVDGLYRFSITPPIPFAPPMAIVMALETYDFNYPSGDLALDGFNGTLEERSTRYQWVRTWEVDNSTSTLANGDQDKALVTIYPNPVHRGALYVQLDPVVRGAKLSIMDVNGVIKRQFEVRSTQVEIPLTDLARGVYWLKAIVDGNIMITKKLIVN
ncbi:MAG: T9SS type A sorting domain-containing protein [Bacteroidota bacterium]